MKNNLYIPRECSERAEDLASKECHWLNKNRVKDTEEYKKHLTNQLKIYYWEETYNLLS